MNKKIFFPVIILLSVILCTSCGNVPSDHSENPSVIHAQSDFFDAPIEITALKTNYGSEPLCIDGSPLFNWQMLSQRPNISQSAYQLLIASSTKDLEQGIYIWDSGKTTSDKSVAIPYTGAPLASATDYYWTVNIWDQNDTLIPAASTAHFKTGLSEDDWQGADWITAASPISDEPEPFSGTISYNVYCPESQSAFFWNADDSYYGDYYRLAIDTISEIPSVQFSVMHYEDITEETIFPIETESPLDWKNSVHRISLSIKDTDVCLTIDDLFTENFSLPESRPLFSYGFWTTRGAYYAYYDDLTITSFSGNQLCAENFEESDHTIFSPYFCKITDSKKPLFSDHCLIAESGFLITPDSMQPAPLFRKAFKIPTDKTIAVSLLYASALGTYDFYINGSSADHSFFAPGQSQYDKEVFYRAMDVTELLGTGENTIAAMLGHGRYDRAKCQWGNSLSLRALLTIQYTDGSIDYIPTDTSWLCYTDGPVRNDDMYAGEFYDATKEVSHWNENNCDETTWDHAAVLSFEKEQSKPQLTAAIAPANICVETLSPMSVTEPLPGVYVCDFGDNITGMCELSFSGMPEIPVVMRYAEHINEENFRDSDDMPGTVWTQGLFTARNTDYCIPGSEEVTIYQPRLVYRGFRYVQISGTKVPVTADDIKAFVITADNDKTGTFTCSDDAINRLYHAIYRTQMNNYVDIPTDCPQRDERFGWAGDAQVFAHTADYYADTHNFIRSYLHTFMLAQRDNGAFPDLLTSSYDGGGNNGWADAGIFLAWELYQQFGDSSVITENIDAMCRYMDYLVETSNDFIRSTAGYSDHNAESILSDDMCNTLQCAYAAKLLSEMCIVANRTDLSEKYLEIYEQYKKAWQSTFLNEDGSVGNWMQSEYVLPLAFGLYPEALEKIGAVNLNISVESGDFHVNTGYIATPWLLPVLCKYGYTDSAYALIRQTSFPSWNYMFSHGNTTLTESFHTFKENDDGSYSIIGSLNHAALGSVGQWIYSDILGIRRDEKMPGFKHFYLEPRIHDSLSYAKGSYDSVYGTIESSWTVEGETFSYECTIPPNTTATLILPGEGFESVELSSGHYSYSKQLFRQHP